MTSSLNLGGTILQNLRQVERILKEMEVIKVWQILTNLTTVISSEFIFLFNIIEDKAETLSTNSNLQIAPSITVVKNYKPASGDKNLEKSTGKLINSYESFSNMDQDRSKSRPCIIPHIINTPFSIANKRTN